MRYLLALFIFSLFFSCNNQSTTPNIVLFVFDKTPFSYSADQGFDFIEGSVFKKIAGQGVTFSSTFTASPSLAIYKRSLRTGLHTGHILSKKINIDSLEDLSDIFLKNNYKIKEHQNLSTWQNQEKSAAPTLDIFWITDGSFPVIEARIKNIFEHLPANTLLIVTAAAGPGQRYSEENLRVPLVMYYPNKFKAGTSTAQPTYTPDLLPTLISVIQLNHNTAQSDGQSVYPYATQPSTPIDDRILYWETAGGQPSQILRFNQWKMVKTSSSSDWLLYDMITDPSETDNVAAYHPGKYQKFQDWIEKNR